MTWCTHVHGAPTQEGHSSGIDMGRSYAILGEGLGRQLMALGRFSCSGCLSLGLGPLPLGFLSVPQQLSTSYNPEMYNVH